MGIYTDFDEFRRDHGSCVATIGKYDGLHLGHQHVLDTLIRKARSAGLPAVVILSEPHPEEYFSADAAGPRLTHFRDKVDFLLAYGVDAIFRMTFDRELCDLSPDAFIRRYLVDGLGVKGLIVGDDFRFGRNRAGDFSLLSEKGAEYGFDVLREEPCLVDGQRVSSTLVRQRLQDGDCEGVRPLLGRYYSISGLVVEGKKLGRELGTPTANIALEARKMPLQGIYSVLVKLGDRELQGVASAGFNPTVDTDGVPKLEVFLFDFDEDIYGERLVVSFVHKLRDETAFPDLEALKLQMAADIQQARSLLAGLAGR